ncbi:MAG: ClbS/DfsB family four-helix bundle protein, partial [Thermomicrobiaceae bacterium]|nr:ClbS/DfsB family four-helix bundle protein [Thermomicrobiaceae bacterium]
TPAADVERINQRFYAASRDRPVAEVLADSRASLDRLEAALLALPEADLFDPRRYPWLDGYPAAAVIVGSAGHLHEEHQPAITAFLARSVPR